MRRRMRRRSFCFVKPEPEPCDQTVETHGEELCEKTGMPLADAQASLRDDLAMISR